MAYYNTFHVYMQNLLKKSGNNIFIIYNASLVLNHFIEKDLPEFY